MQIRKSCLGHGNVMKFQIFPKIVPSWWLKHNKIYETWCQASKRSASGAFHSSFSLTSPLVNFEVMELDF